MIRPAPLLIYGLAWRLALPILKRSARLREGWAQRTGREPLPGPAHLWIQAASVGEAYLAAEILARLDNPLPEPLRVLVTTNTSQGLEALQGILARGNFRAGVVPACAYFPMDAPHIMRAALKAVRPLAAVLLESEIWPGFITACKERGCATLLVNGRMSERSADRYLKLPKFFRSVAPDRVLAMSEADAARFGRVFGPERVGRMHNIKFDRIPPPAPAGRDAGTAAPAAPDPVADPVAALLPPDAPLVVFGSVREDEELHVLNVIAQLLRAEPRAVAALFPRHAHRQEAWEKLLAGRDIPFLLRSRCQGQSQGGTTAPGSVLLWDTFGELGRAYALARAAFVGGSLAPLGGQNFLEPLAAGLRPVIGPHWANFAWVGRDIVRAGLVTEAKDADAVLAALLAGLRAEPDPDGRARTRAAFEAFTAPRRGGALAVCTLVAETLRNGYKRLAAGER
ncbi:MAG: 3-deoxy-D-manno-octulosonic acid transferase [Desulfovibrionaceae bacterium]